MRVNVALKLVGLAGFVETCRLAARAFVERDAQVPGFAGGFEFFGEGGERGLAIGDGFDFDALRRPFSPKLRLTA